jgi:pimeloyl-ACP methyl ester carboxylesterase
LSEAATGTRKRRGGEISRTPFLLRSAEGLEIRGIIERPAKARSLVILLHGFKGFANWGFFPWLSEFLNHQNVATCRFDFSRNGVGPDGENFDRLDLFADDTYSIELDDLRRVTDYVVAQRYLDPLPISLFGFSRGGGLALIAARETPRLRSVATWSAVSNLDRWDEATVQQWRRDGYVEVVNSRTGQLMRMSTALLDDFEKNKRNLDVLRSTRELGVPLLVVHGAKDETVEVEAAQQIAEANTLSSLLIVPNATHTYGAMHPLVTIPDPLLLAARVTSRFLSGY